MDNTEDDKGNSFLKRGVIVLLLGLLVLLVVVVAGLRAIDDPADEVEESGEDLAEEVSESEEGRRRRIERSLLEHDQELISNESRMEREERLRAGTEVRPDEERDDIEERLQGE